MTLRPSQIRALAIAQAQQRARVQMGSCRDGMSRVHPLPDPRLWNQPPSRWRRLLQACRRLFGGQ